MKTPRLRPGRLALALATLALAGCAHRDALGGGISRLRTPGASHLAGRYQHPSALCRSTVELRADRTFRCELCLFGETVETRTIEGTWALGTDGIVRLMTANGEDFVHFTVVRDAAGDLGLWGAPDPTPRSIAGVATGELIRSGAFWRSPAAGPARR